MDSFEVENFRSLKHLKLEKLARVNLLVGKNNSGKTSVLEALVAVTGAGYTSWLSLIEQERKLQGSRADFKYLFYRFDASKPIRLLANHWEPVDDFDPLTSSLEVILQAENRPQIRENGSTGREYPTNGAGRNSVTVLSTTIVSPVIPVPVIFETGRADQNQYYAAPASDGATRMVAGEFELPFAYRHTMGEILTTTIDRATLSQKLEHVKVNKEEGPILEIIQRVAPRIKALQLGGGGQIYCDYEGFQTLMPFDLLGEGVQRLLDIITTLAYSPMGIVLIDEIDNGLHYSALRILWKGILQAAREYDVQVFATTHSAEALRHLTWVLDEEENASFRDDVAAYTLIRAKDDEVRSYRHDYEQLEFALERGIEVRN